ncbi:MAG: hypothetical protein EOO20_17000 [Chryseobacterium sp.]|nr:MAG: hypothetical protein EOO20_17000 [Chryseobacterium sp.]
MEHSETQKEVTQLGKLLIKQLSMERSGDTLGRWMAHYIAEKIVEAENAEGVEKVAANETCFRTILELWKHRWEMKENSRPFREFDRILEVLQGLKPNTERSYFYSEKLNNPKKGDSPWLTAVIETDKAARICLEYQLSKAADNVATPENLAFLDAAQKLGNESDVTIIEMLFDKKDYDFDPSSGKLENDFFEKDYAVKHIEDQISQLDKLSNHIKTIKTAFAANLKFAMMKQIKKSN